MVNLGKDLAKFRFLCDIPIIEITPALEEDQCLICKEPYQNNEWELGRTVHRPVALPCGHVLGFQCLAMWMLSTNFNNHCSLCRAQIYGASTTRAQLSPALASSFARLEVLAVTAENGISCVQRARLFKDMKKSLRGDKALCQMAENGDRIMVVWEEFFNKICNEPVTPAEGNPAAIRGYRVIANWLLDQLSRCLDEDSAETIIWLCFYIASLVIADMALLGGVKAGDYKAATQILMSSRDLFIGSVVGLAFSMPRIPRGYKVYFSGVVSVLLLRALVPLAGLCMAKGFNVLF